MPSTTKRPKLTARAKAKADTDRLRAQAHTLIENAIRDSLYQDKLLGEPAVRLTADDLFGVLTAVVSDVLVGKQTHANTAAGVKKAAKAAARVIRTVDKRRRQ